jgi:hypothetical protein
LRHSTLIASELPPIKALSLSSADEALYLRLDLVPLGFRQVAPPLARIDPRDEEGDPFCIVILISKPLIPRSESSPPALEQRVGAVSLLAIHVPNCLEGAFDSETHATLQLPFVGKDDLLAIDLRACGKRKLAEFLGRHGLRLTLPAHAPALQTDRECTSPGPKKKPVSERLPTLGALPSEVWLSCGDRSEDAGATKVIAVSSLDALEA